MRHHRRSGNVDIVPGRGKLGETIFLSTNIMRRAQQSGRDVAGLQSREALRRAAHSKQNYISLGIQSTRKQNSPEQHIYESSGVKRTDGLTSELRNTAIFGLSVQHLVDMRVVTANDPERRAGA